MIVRSIMLATVFACATAMAGTKNSENVKADVQAAVSSKARPDEDRKRDFGRKPQEVLKFFPVTMGSRVLDVGSGGGYFAELLSNLVGVEGTVIAQNPHFFLGLKPLVEQALARYATGRLKNVVLVTGSIGKLDLPSDSIDAVFFVNTYHDISHSSESGEWQAPTAIAVLQELRRLLKPGGMLAVIDHAAKHGATRANAALIHRIPENTLRSDFERAGFVFVESASFLHNASDDHTNAWFADPLLSDNTDRFAHRYSSPD